MLRYAPGTGPQEGTPERDAEMERWGEVTGGLQSSGAFITAMGLEDDGAAATLRLAGGERVLADGP
jgi:hypothetical protein